MCHCTAILAVCMTLVRLTAALQACTSPNGQGVCSCSGTTVDCSYKSLATVPDDIPASTTSLTLQHNHIEAIEDTAFQNLQELTVLRLDYNNLTSLPRDTFATLYKLTTLYLSHNQITSLDSDIFDGLNLLTGLYLSYNFISDIPLSVANLTSLRDFHMAHNAIKNLQPGMFSNRIIRILDLSYNNITIVPEGAFSNMTTDYEFNLNLRGNPIKQLDKYSFSNIIGYRGYLVRFVIDLSDMQLKKIHENAFFNTFNNVRRCFHRCFFRLNNNRLETLPPTLCNVPSNFRNVGLYLTNNPWSCDCRMRDYIDCARLNFDIICQSPPALNNIRLNSLSRDNLTCSSPTIMNTSPALHEAVVGDTVTLYCNATGFNRPTITWSWAPVPPSSASIARPHNEVNTTMLGYNSVESRLTIDHVQVDDQGHYTCHASNAAGDDSNSFSLFVIPVKTETTTHTGTHVPGNNRDSTHSSGTLIGTAVGSFVGGILLCTIIGLIVYMCKRNQVGRSLREASSSQEATRTTDHSNPAFQQDAEEYEDVSVPQQTAHVYQNNIGEEATQYENVGHPQPKAHTFQNQPRYQIGHGGQDGSKDAGQDGRVQEKRQRRRAPGTAENPTPSTSHLYQNIPHGKHDHVYTSLKKD